MQRTLFKNTTPLLSKNFKIFAFQLEEGTAQTQAQLAFGATRATSDYENARRQLGNSDRQKTGVGVNLKQSNLVCIQINSVDYKTVAKEMKEISSEFTFKNAGYVENYGTGWNILFRTCDQLYNKQLTEHIQLITTAVAIAPTINHHVIGNAATAELQTLKELPSYITNQFKEEVAI